MQDDYDKPEVPATGSDIEEETNIMPGEEPLVPGTIFLSLVLLMVIFGFWVLAYVWLIER
jgi:hypothetical protein